MIHIFSDKPRKRENIAIALGFIIGGLICIIAAISVISVGIRDWSLWIVILMGVVFILIGSYIFYKNKDVFELDTLAKYRDQTQELDNATENKIDTYLKNNVGTAFTAKALLNRIVEAIKNPSFKKFLKKQGEIILNRMVIDGKILSTRKDEETHYFYQSEL